MLSVAYKSGSTTTKTEYVGNKVYKNGTLSMILTQEGYLTLAGTTPTYYYYLKDHQGNNRVVINQSGAVQQVNHYYPFGGLFGEGVQTANQPYKYNGKELDRFQGVDMYDYGARHYDAALGRWLTVDPMAEKYYSISPFVYVANNPIKYVDLRGDSLTIAGKQSEDAVNQFQNRVGNSITLSRDENTGNISYTINTNKKGEHIKLKGDAKRLAEIIDNQDIMVDIKTRESNKTSSGGSMIGGAFMGNTVIRDADGNVVKVIAHQEVNPSIFGRADAITGKTGQLIMHEATEALEGGKISFKSGVGAPPAQMGVDNPVYDAAHKKATKQPMIISTPVAPFSTRLSYSIKGKIFLTDPLW